MKLEDTRMQHIYIYILEYRTTYVPEAEDGGALVALEDAALPLHVHLLYLTRPRVVLLHLGVAQRLDGREQDVHVVVRRGFRATCCCCCFGLRRLRLSNSHSR